MEITQLELNMKYELYPGAPKICRCGHLIDTRKIAKNRLSICLLKYKTQERARSKAIKLDRRLIGESNGEVKIRVDTHKMK